MAFGIKKYLTGGLLLSLAAVAGVAVSCSSTGRSSLSQRELPPIFERGEVTLPAPPDLTTARVVEAADTTARAIEPAAASVRAIDSLPEVTMLRNDPSVAARDTLFPDITVDTTLVAQADTVFMAQADSTLVADTSAVRAVRPRRDKPFLDAPVVGKAEDSLVYDVRHRLIFHYNQGNLVYQDNDLTADYIIVNAATKEIFGTGMLDTAGVMTHAEFIQGGSNYTMDTVRYNLDSGKALVQGVITQDGEGYLEGDRMKRMPDNVINIRGAKYTTCDNVEHPHFYIAMTKAKMIPGKKIITGPAYFVMEDVPVYFLGIPGGFFPISTGPTAGLVMPTYGEESNRGFYLRGGGYYFTFGDYVDLRLTGDLYTLGSWALQAQSNYVKRYKFRGTFSTNYQKFIMGERGSPAGYQNSNQFNVTWNHSQDPKANPRQNFSANVNFSTAGQKQMATTSLQDHLNTNTTSSISYSRNWDVGSTKINMTAAFNLSTNSRDSSLNVTLPNVSLSVSSFSPFKRKVLVGQQRWYEKITLSYRMQAQNSTGTVKESELFTGKTLRGMENGIMHEIPIQTSFNLLNYINFSPSFNYRESWNFQRRRLLWDPTLNNGNGGVLSEDEVEPEFGFFRTYNWNVNGSFSTKIYGQFEVKRKTGWLQAFRHVMTPTLSFSYAPDFRHPRYGFWENVQSSQNGAYRGYQPVVGTPKLTPAGPQASINFSLSNQLELKVRNRRDSAELKKITVIEQLAFNNISYNFLAQGDSMHLSPVSISLRTGEIFKGFAIQLSGTWDPYRYVDVGGRAQRIRKFNIGHGKFGRITSTSWSFGQTFNSPDSASPDPNSINGRYVNPYDPASDPYNFGNGLDPSLRRQYMLAGYYDFSIPWSFTFNYNVNYQYSGLKPVINQTLGFNGNVTLTGKWLIHFDSGYDFTRRKLSHMQLSLARDLHCWEMSFNWVPMGNLKSYSFHIGIKSGMLRDIKYDKSSNMYDAMVR